VVAVGLGKEITSPATEIAEEREDAANIRHAAAGVVELSCVLSAQMGVFNKT